MKRTIPGQLIRPLRENHDKSYIVWLWNDVSLRRSIASVDWNSVGLVIAVATSTTPNPIQMVLVVVDGAFGWTAQYEWVPVK